MTSSSTQGRRSNGDQLLLLATLRRLLRRLLRLRLSLLRHCCPPSHDEWRCRNSAVANRRALHSDYTSTTEKTLTPLNGTCTKRPNPPKRLASPTCNADQVCTDMHALHRCRTQNSSLAEKPDGICILAACMFANRIALHTRVPIRRKPPQMPVLCRFCPVQKKFSTEGQNRRCADARIDQKRANRTSVIRVRACDAPQHPIA